MSGTTDNRGERKKSIIPIDECLKWNAVKPFAAVVISRDDAVTRLRNFDCNAINSTDAAYKRIEMRSRHCEAFRNHVQLSNIVKGQPGHAETRQNAVNSTVKYCIAGGPTDAKEHHGIQDTKRLQAITV
jgi:hypothetical protein